jgi:uncharacterized protein (DUF1778 family)
VPADSERRRMGGAVRLRFLPEHDKLVRQAAKYAGVTISDWVRERLIRAARNELKGQQ